MVGEANSVRVHQDLGQFILNCLIREPGSQRMFPLFGRGSAVPSVPPCPSLHWYRESFPLCVKTSKRMFCYYTGL